jgi:hypothetical protein
VGSGGVGWLGYRCRAVVGMDVGQSINRAYESCHASVSTDGGGIAGNAQTVLWTTIVARNAEGGDCWGSISDGGYNLSTDGSCDFSVANGSLPDTSPRLGRLANNGGRTQTVALKPGSPAMDAIPVGALGVDLTTALCPVSCTEDQRGVARPQGTGCDMGSFERALVTTTTSGRV